MARTTLTTPGEDVGVFGGQYDIYGTTSGGEEITILSGTDVWLDPSFNTGGDTIRLPGEAEEYTARVEGSYVILESTINDITVEIPVGPAGITVVFGGDDTRTLRYDTVDGRVEMEGVAIDGTADPLPPGTDAPPVTYTIDANAPTVTEGDTGTRSLTYTITLDQPAQQDVVLTYTTTAGGSAEVNDDFTPVAGTVTILAGTSTAFVSVPIHGDTLVEGNETVELQVRGSNLAATQVLTGTIIDDDFAATQFNMNPGSETIIGTDAPDTFRASNNELGSGDYVDGRGDVDTLILGIDQDAVNFFDYFGGDLSDGDIDYRGFETDSVENWLVTNDSNYQVTLDMSGANGVQLVGSVNSSEDVRFEQLNSLADILVEDITYSGGTDVEVYYRSGVTAGANDTVTVTVNNSDFDDLDIGTIDNFGGESNTGVENVDLIVSNPGGTTTFDDLDTALTNLTISGTGNLDIDNSLDASIATIDATGLNGDLDINFTNDGGGVDFDGAVGMNVVDAGSGSDTIDTQDADDTVNAGDGNNVVNTNGGDDTVTSGSGADTVDLGTGSNWASVGGGNDFVTATGSTQYNEVYAGTGDDTVVLGDGGSYVELGTGDDNLTTGAGTDVLVSGTGAEDISTGGGSDYAYFYGDLGSEDMVDLGADTDWLLVNAGTVDLDYDNVQSAEILYLLTSGTTVLAAQAQGAGIRTIYGTGGNDIIDATGYNANLTIYPGTGNDTISTGSGDDHLLFTSGGYLSDADVLALGLGLDTVSSTGSIHLDGTSMSGVDVFNLYSNSFGDSIYIHNLGALNADETGTLVINAGSLGSDDYFELDPTVWGVSPTYILDVTGGGGDDYIEGGTNNDDLRGGAGDDTIFGLAGHDNIHGGAGDDTIDGGLGSDEVFGDLGADTIELGADGWSDVVYYSAVNQSSGVVGEGRDTLNNFVSGEDEIDISELLANEGITSTEFISAQDIDAAEAAMVAGDGVYSIVFIETLPGEPTEVGDDADGFFFVDVNDDGELGGEDLQLFVNGGNVTAGDVDTTTNVGGGSDFDTFINDLSVPAAVMLKMEDASYA